MVLCVCMSMYLRDDARENTLVWTVLDCDSLWIVLVYMACSYFSTNVIILLLMNASLQIPSLLSRFFGMFGE